LIEREGEKPIPLQLVVRLCPEETEAIDGATVRETVTGLYDMHALEFRAEFMRKVRGSLARYP
jgi:hypothetical protein